MTISLPARAIELKEYILNCVPENWDVLTTSNRAQIILMALDNQAIKYHDNFSYDIFLKGFHTARGQSITMDISFTELVEVLETAERYAKNWIFS
jgi:hypothetical protein